MQENVELKRWNGRYSAPAYVFGTEPNAFLASQAPRLKPGMQALSIADGEGRNGVWLASQGGGVPKMPSESRAPGRSPREEGYRHEGL